MLASRHAPRWLAVLAAGCLAAASLPQAFAQTDSIPLGDPTDDDGAYAAVFGPLVLAQSGNDFVLVGHEDGTVMLIDPSGPTELDRLVLGGAATEVAFDPSAAGTFSLQPGETWTFQDWHRDMLPSGVATSNTSTAIAITFR